MTLRAAIAGVLIVAAPLVVDAQRGGAGQGGRGGTGPGPGGGRGIGPGRAGPATERPQVPAFRSSVTLVQLDAIVTDAQGNPVKGLAAEDFEVFEGGDRRDVATFAAVDIPMDAPRGMPTDDTTEPDVQTNVGPQGRTYLFALDEVSPDQILRTRNFVRRFVADHLGPNDVAAVALTGRGLSTSGQDFTSNRRLVLNAVDKFSGGFATFEGAARSDPRQLASSFRKLTEFLGTLPGRKTLVYIGEGVSGLDFFDVVDYKGGALTPAAIDAHATIVAATRGNVTIYPVDPRGLTTDLTPAEALGSSILDERTDMLALASTTGGFAITNTNNISEAFARIVRENSTYYTIGFNAEYSRRDGRFVPVEIRVKRPGLQVRSRNGYVAPRGGGGRRGPVEGDSRLQSVKNALANATSSRGLPIRVFAAPYKASGDKSTIALAVEIDVAALGGQLQDNARTSEIEISYVATDASGKVRPGRRHTASVAVTGEPTTNKGRNVRLLSQFELADGRYQLRVAAGSASMAGSVVYDLEVPDFTKGPLAMSGVSLTSTGAAAISTLKPHDPLADALPAPPTASREFASNEQIVLFAEVYDNRNAGQDPIEFSTALTTEQGRIVRAPNPESRAPTAVRRKSGGHGFTARLPLEGLGPGAYVILVQAQAGGPDGPTVSRRIPIRVR
jgi:VWFA-related protein